MQALTPAVQALAGTYVAVLPTSEGDVQCELSLAADSTATFRTSSKDGRTASYAGGWLSDGGTIQLALRNPADPSTPVAVTLEPRDGAVFVVDVEGRKSPYAGLTFVRSTNEPSVIEKQKPEKS